jgi:hypothetical protein
MTSDVISISAPGSFGTKKSKHNKLDVRRLASILSRNGSATVGELAAIYLHEIVLNSDLKSASLRDSFRLPQEPVKDPQDH